VVDLARHRVQALNQPDVGQSSDGSNTDRVLENADPIDRHDNPPFVSAPCLGARRHSSYVVMHTETQRSAKSDLDIAVRNSRSETTEV
jgi:hypothetical protein